MHQSFKIWFWQSHQFGIAQGEYSDAERGSPESNANSPTVSPEVILRISI